MYIPQSELFVFFFTKYVFIRDESSVRKICFDSNIISYSSETQGYRDGVKGTLLSGQNL